MFCHVCGAETPNDAKYCPRCGAALMTESATSKSPSHMTDGWDAWLDLNQTSVTTSKNPSHMTGSSDNQDTKPDLGETVTTKPESTSDAGANPLCILESALSVLLAAAVAFAPMVKIPFVGSYPILEVANNLSKLNLPKNYAGIGPALVILMIIACLCSLINAKEAFSAGTSGTSASVKTELAGVVPVYAVFLLVILGAVSSKSYSIIAATGWVWFLLIGGFVCVGIHRARCSKRTPVQSSNVQSDNAA